MNNMIFFCYIYRHKTVRSMLRLTFLFLTTLICDISLCELIRWIWAHFVIYWNPCQWISNIGYDENKLIKLWIYPDCSNILFDDDHICNKVLSTALLRFNFPLTSTRIFWRFIVFAVIFTLTKRCARCSVWLLFSRQFW
jgi:hypothetical protein